MAVHQLSPRVRQAHMHHTDPRLTDNTYMDETLLPVADELFNMPWIPEPDTKIPESIHLKKATPDALCKKGSLGSVQAQNMHQTSSPIWQELAINMLISSADTTLLGYHRKVYRLHQATTVDHKSIYIHLICNFL